MQPAATRPKSSSDDVRPVPTLYLAFELGNRDWKLGLTTGFGQPPRERTIGARGGRSAAVAPGAALHEAGPRPDYEPDQGPARRPGRAAPHAPAVHRATARAPHVGRDPAGARARRALAAGMGEGPGVERADPRARGGAPRGPTHPDRSGDPPGPPAPRLAGDRRGECVALRHGILPLAAVRPPPRSW